MTHLGSTFLPLPSRGVAEQEAIQQTITPDAPVSWPTIGHKAVNEFTTEGYMSSAFPTLFPTGQADFLAPRQRSVTIGNFFKNLLLHYDQRCAKHPRFRYVIFIKC